jgi:hypothetical protein
MRKLLSIALFAAVMMPGVMPLLAATQTNEGMACCRRDGKHHCMLKHKHAGPEGSPAFSAEQEKCPMQCCVTSRTQVGIASLGNRIFVSGASGERIIFFADQVFAAVGFSSHTDRGPPSFHLV